MRRLQAAHEWGLRNQLTKSMGRVSSETREAGASSERPGLPALGPFIPRPQHRVRGEG